MIHFEDIVNNLSSLSGLPKIDYSAVEREYSLERTRTVNDSPTDCEFSGVVFYDLYSRDESGVLIASFEAYYSDGDLDDILVKVSDQIRYQFFVSKVRDVVKYQVMSKILDL